MAASKSALGQFFTPNPRVQRAMLALVDHHTGRALEPSAGAGDLALALEAHRPGLSLRCFELDDTLSHRCATPVEHGDFFDLAVGLDASFDVVFGNPPYVGWKSVLETTRTAAAATKSHYSDKTNLYHLFIHRLAELLTPGGEMVLITPKEWLYTTSAAPLRRLLAHLGALTHVIDCGEEKLFDDADVPAIVIFRFVAGATQGEVTWADSLDAALANTTSQRRLVDNDGRWLILEPALADHTAGWARLGDLMEVKVGLVTGRDQAFRLAAGHTVEPAAVRDQVTTSRAAQPFVWLEHVTDAEAIPAGALAHLGAHKPALLARRIARFDETNWWRYGAVRNLPAMDSTRPRFFALAKTRSPQPFFCVPGAKYFAGGVLGIFPKDGCTLSCEELAGVLNSAKYREVLESMGLATGDKISLQPATLEDAPFPADPDLARALIEP